MLVYIDDGRFVFHAASNNLRFLITKSINAMQADTENPMDGHVAIYRECGELLIRHSYGNYKGVARLRRNFDDEYCLTIFAELGKGAGRLLYELMAIIDIIG